MHPNRKNFALQHFPCGIDVWVMHTSVQVILFCLMSEYPWPQIIVVKETNAFKVKLSPKTVASIQACT